MYHRRCYLHWNYDSPAGVIRHHSNVWLQHINSTSGERACHNHVRLPRYTLVIARTEQLRISDTLDTSSYILQGAPRRVHIILTYVYHDAIINVPQRLKMNHHANPSTWYRSILLLATNASQLHMLAALALYYPR